MIERNVNINKDYSFVSPAHIRAARGWLGWNLDIASEKTGLTRQTINRFETGYRKVSDETVAILVESFERAGVLLRRDGLRVIQLTAKD